MLKLHQKEFLNTLINSKNKLDMVSEYLSINKSESEDIDFISELIKIDPWMFRYASVNVQENKSFILENIQRIHLPLKQVVEKELLTYGDKNFLIQLQKKIDEENNTTIYKITSDVFDYCNKSFFSNKEFVLELKHISLISRNFRKLSQSLRDDRDIVNLYIDYCCLNSDYICLMYFSDRLKNDKDLILGILKKQNSYTNIERNSILAIDKDIIKEALLASKENILNISLVFLNDEENFKYVIEVLVDGGNYVFKSGEPRNKTLSYLLKTNPGKKLLQKNSVAFFKNDIFI